MTQPSGTPGIGLSLPTWPRADGTMTTWPEMRVMARDAEALGVDRLWVADHLVRVLPSGRRVDFRECWTILTATAEATSRIGVGPLVASTGFRNPGLLARMADTLSEVSGGRLVLGLGSGVPATDTSWRMFGYDAERHVGRFEASVEVVARLLRGETVTFDGDGVRLDGASLRAPRDDDTALGTDRTPVWVAAKGPRTMAVAARWADAVNLNAPLATPEGVAGLAALAAEACRRVGRDPATLELTGWGRIALAEGGIGAERPGWLAGPPEAIATTLRSMAGVGLRHIALYIGLDDDASPLPALTPRALERLAPVLEAMHAA